MLSPGTIDRFCHFEFKNGQIIEVRGDFGVMGFKTLNQNPFQRAIFNIGAPVWRELVFSGAA
jgi:hypothetical protein